MSDQKQLSNEEAYNVLVAEVHAPVFFEKLARVWGVKPQSNEEARELLMMAAELRSAHEQDLQKTAAQNTNFYSEARRDLTNVLNQRGFQPIVNSDESFQKAANTAVQNPLIKEAALVYTNYLAQALQQA